MYNWIQSEIVYTYSEEARRELEISSPIMTFTQPSLRVFLSEYLRTLPSLEAMKKRTQELFDMFVMPCKINSYLPECRKTAFRGYIDKEVDSMCLAKTLSLTPDAFGTVHADSKSV